MLLSEVPFRTDETDCYVELNLRVELVYNDRIDLANEQIQ